MIGRVANAAFGVCITNVKPIQSIGKTSILPNTLFESQIIDSCCAALGNLRGSHNRIVQAAFSILLAPFVCIWSAKVLPLSAAAKAGRLRGSVAQKQDPRDELLRRQTREETNDDARQKNVIDCVA